MIQLVADELSERPAGGSVAKLIRRVIGNMPTELAGEADAHGSRIDPAAKLVKAALAKSTPAVVAAAIGKRIDQCKSLVSGAGLPGDMNARAMQLLGNAAALAAKVSANVARAPKQKPAAESTERPPKRSTEMQTADTSPAAAKSGGVWSRMVQAAKDNPLAATTLVVGTLLALRRKS